MKKGVKLTQKAMQKIYPVKSDVISKCCIYAEVELLHVQLFGIKLPLNPL